jgi:hypothetical protein
MLMPETSIDKNGPLFCREDHIGRSGQCFHVKPIAIPFPEEAFPDGHLRAGVLVPYGPHNAAAGFC